jgi:hypothetical protein
MSVTLQTRWPFNVDLSRGNSKNQLESGQESMGNGPVFSLFFFFAKKFLTETDRCAGALS